MTYLTNEIDFYFNAPFKTNQVAVIPSVDCLFVFHTTQKHIPSKIKISPSLPFGRNQEGFVFPKKNEHPTCL